MFLAKKVTNLNLFECNAINLKIYIVKQCGNLIFYEPATSCPNEITPIDKFDTALFVTDEAKDAVLRCYVRKKIVGCCLLDTYTIL